MQSHQCCGAGAEPYTSPGVAVTPQRAGAGLAITQIPRNLPGPGAAVQSSCCEDCILELLPYRTLPLRVREVMGRIQRPIHRKASPTTLKNRLSQRKVGTTEEIHHKRRLVFRSFGYIPKRRRSQVISWAPSRLRLGLTWLPGEQESHKPAQRAGLQSSGAPHCRSSCWSRCPC